MHDAMLAGYPRGGSGGFRGPPAEGAAAGAVRRASTHGSVGTDRVCDHAFGVCHDLNLVASRSLVAPCTDTVFRALAGQFVVPNFDTFAQTCVDIVKKCQKAPDSVAICTIDGQLWLHGDPDVSVCFQELTHCVTYLIAREELGRDGVHARIGAIINVMLL